MNKQQAIDFIKGLLNLECFDSVAFEGDDKSLRVTMWLKGFKIDYYLDPSEIEPRGGRYARIEIKSRILTEIQDTVVPKLFSEED